MIWFATLSFKCKSFKAYKQQSLCRVDAPVTIVIGQSWKHVQWLVDLLTNFTACITCITCITWITSITCITCITCITGITGITGNPKNINDSLTHWVTTWNQEMLAHLKIHSWKVFYTTTGRDVRDKLGSRRVRVPYWLLGILGYVGYFCVFWYL